MFASTVRRRVGDADTQPIFVRMANRARLTVPPGL
jgi:hypothetical protein